MKVHSAKTRKKMSIAAKQRWSDPVARAEISAKLRATPGVGRPRKPAPVIKPRDELRRARILKQAAEMTKSDATRRRLIREAEQAEQLAAAA